MSNGRSSSVIVGVALLVIGLWYFADRTLGLDCRGSTGGTSGRSP